MAPMQDLSPVSMCRPQVRAWLFAWVILMGLVLVSCPVWAGEIAIRNPRISLTDEGYTLSAETTIELGGKLEEALTRGVSLYFVQEFEMSRPRWYWIEDKRFGKSQTLRLYYHALTRQYRVGMGGVHQSFPSLEEALKTLVHLRYWLILDKNDQGSLKVGESYQASLRIRLDGSQLPRPLQINVLFARDWELEGEVRWTYVVPAQPVAETR